jgi:fluoride exporter
VLPDLPIGTLIANLSAGYIIGLAVAFFARYPDVPLEWRLFVITGILGGLSTFSTFSAEVTAHLQAGRIGWALGEIAVHVIGSVLMTMLGILTITTLVKR